MQAYLVFWALSALGACCMSSRALHLYVFPLLTPVVCFPALGTRYVFSRAKHPLYVFPRQAPVVCFPAQASRCMFSRARHPLSVFPCLALVCFLALNTCCICLCCDWSVLITLVTKYWKTRHHGSAIAGLVTGSLLASISTANRVM